jgi:hypothetical protein
MSSQLLPASDPLQFTHAAPKFPHVVPLMAAHVPSLQHEVWHVPSVAPPQLPLHVPFAPHVGV